MVECIVLDNDVVVWTLVPTTAAVGAAGSLALLFQVGSLPPSRCSECRCCWLCWFDCITSAVCFLFVIVVVVVLIAPVAFAFLDYVLIIEFVQTSGSENFPALLHRTLSEASARTHTHINFCSYKFKEKHLAVLEYSVLQQHCQAPLIGFN